MSSAKRVLYRAIGLPGVPGKNETEPVQRSTALIPFVTILAEPGTPETEGIARVIIKGTVNGAMLKTSPPTHHITATHLSLALFTPPPLNPLNTVLHTGCKIKTPNGPPELTIATRSWSICQSRRSSLSSLKISMLYGL